MKAFVNGSCSRLSAGVALALLLAAALPPGEARAGCGDHATVIAPAPLRTSARPADVSPAPPNPPCPCSGPGCSRSPLTPLQVPVAPVVPPGQDWACAPAPPALPLPPASSADVRDEDAGPPLGAGAAVYHPPR